MRNSKIALEIKRLAEEQVSIKPQRKTINFSGERTISSYNAVAISEENKVKLRHLYVAYNVLRCKEVVKFSKREFIQPLVDKYVEEYKEDFAPKTE